ncbi:MAG: fibronectin type III domain-containing protein [Solirubrobacteraceae bacterium]
MRKVDRCDPIDNRLVSRILGGVCLATVYVLLTAGPSLADNSNKGLGSEATVPAWARNKNIHFLAPPRSNSTLTPALGGRLGASHTDLGLRCEPGYCPQPPLEYKGGVVQHNPTVYLIFWGSSFNKGTLRTEMLDLFNSLSSTGSNPSYQGILTQYWDGGGGIAPIDVVAGNYLDMRVAAPSGVSEQSVEEEVAYAISVNSWPPSGTNPQYVVLTPSGTTYQSSFVKNSKGEAAFCGYHERTGGVSYSFIPSEYDEPFYSGCALGYDHSGPNGETLPNHATTMVASHEYAETATDPEPSTHPGWKDSEGYEIGDICSSGDDKLPGGSWVQGLWGNHENACVLQDPPYSPPPAPAVTTEAATSIEYRQANLNGSVNPNGPDAHYYFQYGTTTGYGSATLEGDAGYGDSNTGESATITGLKPGTTYHYRLVANSWVGTTDGPDKEFTTPIPPPVVKTEPPTEVGDVHATLNALVNPEEFSTTYQMEYWQNGKSSEVQKIPATPQAVGSGTSSVKVSQHLSGLPKSTEYIYRVTATNAGGTTKGKEVSFVTGPFLEPRTSPTPSGAKENVLRGVSCLSSTSCVAVGSDIGSGGNWEALGEIWNGAEWKLSAMVTPSGSKNLHAEAVSCSSATACTAVGSYETSSGAGEVLAERWNGTEWKTQSVPNPNPAGWASLVGVSCTSATSCEATGSVLTAAFETTTFGAIWNGTEWKLQTTLSPEAGAALGTVSCTSASACTSVGGMRNNVLIERWNGTAWSTQNGVKIPAVYSQSLRGVSCTSATACIAVGSYEEKLAGPLTDFAEIWNGTEWTRQTVPTPGGAKETNLERVSCTSSTSCIATGRYMTSAGAKLALGEMLSGTEWQVVSIPNPTGAQASQLSGVSCASSVECVGVGFYENSLGAIVTLAEVGP